MRINDGSICINCKYFDHDCDLENGCIEYCENSNENIRDSFLNDDIEPIKECEGFKGN
ncbi:hypothetical protein [Rossellomorea marisflavi]|uniref:hypothetical protein n=1 Tax=Rossellomorea marisflavi TaxID=189381 RepID=UPI00345CEDA2